MFFETIGLAVCSCVLLGVAAVTGLFALANYPLLFAGNASLMNRIRWLVLAAAPVIAIIGILAAWVALFSGNSGGAGAAIFMATLWAAMAGVLLFRGAGRPQVYTWTSRAQSPPPDIIVMPALPPKDEEPRNSL